MNQENLEFSKFRAFFWPIHSFELKKFLPMMALFFCISFNYHLLRIAKDSLVIPVAGAEAIPFLKVWAILPSAIFLTFLFTKLSNKFHRESIFYIMVSIFLGFFIIFLLVLYPFKDALFLNSTADYLQTVLSKGFYGFISIIRYWIYSLFYIMSEAWSTIVLSILLWGFANDVTKVKEAKRFYALFGIGINAAGIFAGHASAQLVTYMQQKNIANPIIKLLGGDSSWDQTVIALVSIIIFVSLISIVIYRYLHVKFFSHRASFADCEPNIKEPKNKMSLRKNISYILQSKYLLSIAVIVVAYNIAINLTEVLWKTQMRELYPNPADYTAYMSKVTFFIGITATVGSYFVSGSYIRLFGWKATALLTPLIIIVTGIGFFYFLFLKNFSNSTYIIFGMTPLALSVFFGSLQNVLTRSAKYTVFDSTKEMTFIPLSDENKLKGKTAIDGIGSRLGKSGSSFIMQILLMIFTTTSACSPIIGIILFLMIPFWITAINSVNKNFKEISAEKLSEN